MAFRHRAVPPFAPRRRVVVTGMGSVTSLGVGVEALWSGLQQNRSSAALLEKAPYFIPNYAATSEEKRKAITDALPCKVACYVTTPPSMLGPKGQDPFGPTSTDPRYTRFAKHAAAEAMKASGLVIRRNQGDAGHLDDTRVGINIGVGMPSLSDVSEVGHLLYDPSAAAPKYNKISPYFVPKILGNMAAGAVAIEHGLRGPNLSSVTACATGGHCIGESARMIQLGFADAMVCGAAEATINAIGVAGFSRMRALSTKYNATPELASRPFDQGRDGFVMGEGAGALVLEAEDVALARGATIYAEVRGCGSSGDAFHITSPRDDGGGARQSLEEALRDAGIGIHEVTYINAHATSTPLGDGLELSAIEAVLQQSQIPHRVHVSSSKGHFGHLLGAAGAVEAITSILAVHKGVVPPTCNLTDPIPHDVDRVHLVRGTPVVCDVAAAVSLSFGFGGTNTAVVFTQY